MRSAGLRNSGPSWSVSHTSSIEIECVCKASAVARVGRVLTCVASHYLSGVQTTWLVPGRVGSLQWALFILALSTSAAGWLIGVQLAGALFVKKWCVSVNAG